MTRHPQRPRVLTAAPLLLVLALTACGSADTPGATAADDVAPADAATGAAAGGAGGASGICLEGSTGCQDAPTGTGGAESGADGSVPVGEAVSAQIQGPFLMSGYLLIDGGGARLCEALAESFPPQCGGTSVLLMPAEAPAGATTTTEGDVTWTEQPLLVEGEIVDRVFVVRAA